MRMRRALAIVSLLAVTACRRDETDAPAKPTPEGASSSNGGAAASAKSGPVASAKQNDGTMATWTGRCAEVVVALQAELSKLPSSCSTDGDCVCYRGGVGGVTECGAVSDLAAAKRIDALTEEFGAARCSHSVNCAAFACKVACISGSCRASPP